MSDQPATTLPNALRLWSRATPSAVALRDGDDGSRTTACTARSSRWRAGSRTPACGAATASRWWPRTRAEWVLAFLACLASGAVVVPMNARLGAAELGRQLQIATPRLALVGGAYEDLLARAAPELAAAPPGARRRRRDLAGAGPGRRVRAPRRPPRPAWSASRRAPRARRRVRSSRRAPSPPAPPSTRACSRPRPRPRRSCWCRCSTTPASSTSWRRCWSSAAASTCCASSTSAMRSRHSCAGRLLPDRRAEHLPADDARSSCRRGLRRRAASSPTAARRCRRPGSRSWPAGGRRCGRSTSTG